VKFNHEDMIQIVNQILKTRSIILNEIKVKFNHEDMTRIVNQILKTRSIILNEIKVKFNHEDMIRIVNHILKNEIYHTKRNSNSEPNIRSEI
jgi:glutamate synthase domain-containing protein 3